jgi:hypothetical protein
MTSKEFVIWLKGFIAGSASYNLTPVGWHELKDQLKTVNDHLKTPPCSGHDQESWSEEEAERRMDIIGQNGNEGLHYSAEDLGGQWVTTTTNDKLENNG